MLATVGHNIIRLVGHQLLKVSLGYLVSQSGDLGLSQNRPDRDTGYSTSLSGVVRERRVVVAGSRAAAVSVNRRARRRCLCAGARRSSRVHRGAVAANAGVANARVPRAGVRGRVRLPASGGSGSGVRLRHDGVQSAAPAVVLRTPVTEEKLGTACGTAAAAAARAASRAVSAVGLNMVVEQVVVVRSSRQELVSR